MKSLWGLAIGCGLTAMLACGGAMQKSAAPVAGGAPPTSVGMEPGGGGHAEIDRLDADITAQMGKLNLPRPSVPPNACVRQCEPQQLSGVAATATEPAPPACKPAKTEVCTDVCELKKSICDSSGRICKIAEQLGGNDAYANDKCQSGAASCEAAKTRCCGCM